MHRPLALLLGLLIGSCQAFAADFSARFDAIRKAATPEQLYAFLYDLPKGGDLHNHAGGSNLPQWIWAVLTDSKRNGDDTFYARVRFANAPESAMPFVKFRTIRQHTYEQLPASTRNEYAPLASLSADEKQAWLSSFELDRPGEGRDEFFSVSIWTRFGDFNSNPQVRFELLADNIKAFSAEHVRYLETMFGIDGLKDNDGNPISAEDGLDMLRRRLSADDLASTGVAVRFLEVILRFAPNAEQALERTYAFVDAHRDLWVGLNMAGIEENGHGYPSRFLDTFRKLRRTYPTLPLSIHAGEMDGPDSHVRDTLLLGASRIGHGINLIQDDDTMLLLQQTRRVLVEINLISNRLLEYVPNLSLHPFPEYLRTGIPVCLNTDDRGIWSSNMTDEYYTAVTTFTLSWPEIVAVGRNSLAFSFAQPELKRRLLDDYMRDIESFESEYERGSIDDVLAKLDTINPVAYEYPRRTWGFDFREPASSGE